MKQHTKFGANRLISGWDTPACVFPRWRWSAIWDLLLSSTDLYILWLQHWTNPRSSIEGLYLYENGVTIRSDVTETSRLYAALLGQLLGHNRGRGPILTPTNSFSLLGFFSSIICYSSWKSIKKCDRERADRQIDRQTDRQTHAKRMFIICPIAMGQILKIIYSFVYFYE